MKHLLIPLFLFFTLANPVNAKYWSDIDLMTMGLRAFILILLQLKLNRCRNKQPFYCAVKNEKIVALNLI